MTVDSPHINYEALAQMAMRGLVRSVLEQTAKSGLPGDHHFYISFDTCADGVSISKRLKEKYANEMTIVLQHRFWDLNVRDDGFDVKLTFDGIPERLVVPYSAIKVFFDPSVRYGLQFEDPDDAINDHDHITDASTNGPLHGIGGEIMGTRPELVRAPTKSSTQNEDTTRTRAEIDGAPNGKDTTADSSPSIEDEPTVLDSEDVAKATKGAQILRLDAFRKKSP